MRENASQSHRRQRRQVRVIKILFLLFCIALTAVIVLACRFVQVENRYQEYDDYFLEIEKRDQAYTDVTFEERQVAKESNGNPAAKTTAAEQLIDCFTSSPDTDDLPKSVSDAVDAVNRYYRKNNNYFAFAYKDLSTGFTVTYNANQSIYAASTVKAPADIYLYEQAAAGKLDLEETMTYTKNDWHDGSGVIRNEPFGTKYTVRKLIRYSVIHSDNVAHCMLMGKYGRSNMLSFWQKKGTNAIFTMNTNWGLNSAHDALIYMQELYDFYLEDETYGGELMQNFLDTKTKFIAGVNGYPVANKGGWDGSVIHDASIVFAENPYIVAAFSNLYNTNDYDSYFQEVNQLAYSLHKAYWQYKTDLLNNIPQYR